jgi:hypothetical protein
MLASTGMGTLVGRLVALCLLALSAACTAEVTPQGSSPASPSRPALATANEQRTWRALEDELCQAAGGCESQSTALWFSLARRAFFNERETALKSEGATFVQRIAGVAHSLNRTVRVEVRLEDEAASQPDADRIANARADALRRALMDAGARGTVVSHTSEFEGDYDGPLALDPAAGRVDFALVGSDDRILHGQRRD